MKLYSWYAPEVECIGKGKADKPYEFGCKVSVTTSVNRALGGHFVLQVQALYGRPYDGHTLNTVMEGMKRFTGATAERNYVDRDTVDMTTQTSIESFVRAKSVA